MTVHKVLQTGDRNSPSFLPQNQKEKQCKSKIISIFSKISEEDGVIEGKVQDE